MKESDYAKMQDFLRTLRQLNDIWELNEENPHVHVIGRESERLREELGIEKIDGKSPYEPSEWSGLWTLNAILGSQEWDKLPERWKAYEATAQALRHATLGTTDDEPALKSLKNPVTCTEVAGIIRKRSDNIARTLRDRRYPVVMEGRKCYCDAEDAAILWPKWKKHWQEKKNKDNL